MAEDSERPRIMPLKRAYLEQAVDVLASAFEHDPLMRYLFAESPAPHEQNLRALFRFSCEVRYLLDWPLLGSFDGTRLVGVAGITEPEAKAWPPELESVYGELRAFIGPVAAAGLEEYSRKANVHRPAGPHYHLGVIGVHLTAQGRGHGRALLETLQDLSEKHPTSTGVWLDTETQRNVSIYRRCGYQVVAQTGVADVPIWCMFRPNRQRRD